MTGPTSRAMPRWVFGPFGPLLLLLLVSPIIFALQITHDAAWQTWIARQMLNGADLYTDIIEVNPPLWFWLAVPLEVLAKAFEVHSLDVLILLFLPTTAVTIFLSSALIREWPDRYRLVFLMTLVVVAVPLGNFGQREHFTLVATVPYVLLIGRRSTGLSTSQRLAIFIGLLAALGFALKPHFALVPIVLELWLRRPLVRPETIALAASAVFYGACVLIFEPDYLGKAIPLAQQAYGQFGNFRPAMLLPTALTMAIAALLIRPKPGVASALLVASLAFYLVFVIQLKGFAYHAFPAMGFLALALVAFLPAFRAVEAVCALAVATFALIPNMIPYRTDAWADVPVGSSYAALSVAPRAAWPMVEERRLRWSLRSMSLWMAPAVGSQIKPAVEQDIQCNRPEFILVDDSRFPFSEMFADTLAYYREVNRNGQLSLMRLVRPLPKPPRCPASWRNNPPPEW